MEISQVWNIAYCREEISQQYYESLTRDLVDIIISVRIKLAMK